MEIIRMNYGNYDMKRRSGTRKDDGLIANRLVPKPKQCQHNLNLLTEHEENDL